MYKRQLEYCEKYGFDYIDIQSECLNRDLEAGKITLEEMGEWFKNHHLKMLSYNALCFFNMKQTQEEKDAVMAELDEIIRRCDILGCKMIVVVPSKDMKERGLTPTRKEIREDAVAVLKEMVKKCEPHGIKPVSYTHLDVYKRQVCGVIQMPCQRQHLAAVR